MLVSTYDLLKAQSLPNITFGQAAKIMGNHVSTWWLWLSENLLPVGSFVVGKSRRIRLIDLCNYIDAQVLSSTPSSPPVNPHSKKAAAVASEGRGRKRKYGPAVIAAAESDGQSSVVAGRRIDHV
jgi:hypothetical protein